MACESLYSSRETNIKPHHQREGEVTAKCLDQSTSMAKNMREIQENLNKKLGSKFMQGFRGGDQPGLKSKDSISKTPMYVHQYNKPSYKNSNIFNHDSRQNVYNHGFQGYYNEKTNFLKTKFDNLSLCGSNAQKNYTMRKCANLGDSNKVYKCPVHQSKINMKLRGLNVDKNVLHQLEENYWINWKPNNKSTGNTTMPKTRLRLFSDKKISQQAYPITEVDEPESSIKSQETIKSDTSVKSYEGEKVEYIHKPSSLYDTKSSETQFPTEEDSDKTIFPRSDSMSYGNVENIGDSTNYEHPQNLNQLKMTKNLNALEPKLSLTVTPHLAFSKDSNSSEHENMRTIRHTDSLIITAKKQQQIQLQLNRDKVHYQQPRCIKLQKKEPTELVKSSRNYIKGGSYPLKSCLKSDKVASKKSLVLGKPGSSVILVSSKKIQSRKFRKK